MIGEKGGFTHLKMVICIPSGITEVEKRAVFDSADHVDSKETLSQSMSPWQRLWV